MRRLPRRCPCREAVALLLLVPVLLLLATLASVCQPGGYGGLAGQAPPPPMQSPPRRADPRRRQPPSTAASTTAGCPHRAGIVSINSAGRLGNIMSEYATLLAVNETLRRPAWVLASMEQALRSVFEAPSLPALRADCRVVWKRTSLANAKSSRLTANDTDYLITGFPHDVPLFHPLRRRLRREFAFRPALRARAQRTLAAAAEAANRSAPVFVGVHVRRTDYARWLNRSVHGHLVGHDYLHRALTLMRRRHPSALFVVTSDDLAWCQRELHTPNLFLAGNRDLRRPGDDLALLAACNHTVLTHGTFGFWAGYLAGGQVVMPAGYGRRPTDLDLDIRRAQLGWTSLKAFDYS